MISRRNLLLTGSASALTALLAQPAFAQKGQRQSAASNAAKQARSKVAMQSQRRGGHLHRHVARSRNQLKANVASKSMRLNFNAARYGATLGKGGNMRKSSPGVVHKRQMNKAITKLQKFKVSKKHSSTFHSARTADKMYAQAVRSQRKQINAWLKNPKKTKPFRLGVQSKKPIGSVYSGRSNSFRAARKGQFFLKKTKGGRFYPHSAKLW